MAVCSSPSIFSTNSVPKIRSNSPELRITVSTQRSLGHGVSGKRTWRRLNAAGLSEIEPDLNEDPVDRWATNSVSPVLSLSLTLFLLNLLFYRRPYSGFCLLAMLICVVDFQEDFIYGKYDGHHTYNEAEDKGIFLGDNFFLIAKI